jgi:hypothetical protein
MLATRGSSTPERAEILGRWAFGIGLCLLVPYGLNTVSIPLTDWTFSSTSIRHSVTVGVTIALTQRDIHIDREIPRVEISRASNAKPESRSNP